MNSPLVSIVMSVRNGGLSLVGSINSILRQTGVDFELIIVNDGSTDETSLVLQKLSKHDSRISILTREARGLTISLIEGCQMARGKYIARQDALDFSLDGRLQTQVQMLESHPEATLCSSYVRFITREGATVFNQCMSNSDQDNTLVGIIHGSTMFRKEAYLNVGGYRSEFYYAQDVDLWSRLTEVGKHVVVHKIFYENCIYPGSISSSRKKEQTILHDLILAATNARRYGNDENKYLTQASFYSQKCRLTSNDSRKYTSGAYFIGSCLLKSNPNLAKKYLQMSVDSNPFNIKARFRLLCIK
jgi:glycosyltransferase involved in cell wall biosynthesis